MISKRMKTKMGKKSGIREAFNEAQRQYPIYGRENVFDLSIGNPLSPVPQKVNEIVKELADDPTFVHHYMCDAGYEDVRKKIVASLNRIHGTAYDENDIVMTCGAAGGINIVLCTLIDPGEEVVLISPYYPAYEEFVDNWGGIVVDAPADDQFLPDLQTIDCKITEKTKAIIVNSPHNPTGVVYPKQTMMQLAELLKEKEKLYGHEIYLLSDEPYRDLLYDGVEIGWWPEYYDNSVIVYSFSKSLSLAGERIGYVLVPKTLADQEVFVRAIRLASGKIGYVNAPAMFQKVVGACVDEKVDIEFYEQNRKVLVRELRRLGFEFVDPQGAFYIYVKTPVPEDDFLEMARKRHLMLVGGSVFGRAEYARISFCCDHGTIERSITALELLAEDCGLREKVQSE